MDENSTTNQADAQYEVNPGSFVLFLLLVLLFMSNQNTFDDYFQLLEKETNKINNLIQGLNMTANGLQSALKTPQEFDFQI